MHLANTGYRLIAKTFHLSNIRHMFVITWIQCVPFYMYFDVGILISNSIEISLVGRAPGTRITFVL